MKQLVTISLTAIAILAIINLIVSANELDELQKSNDYKRELIEAYEVYYDAAEQIIEDDYVNMDYYNQAKARLDSLYRAEL